MDKNILFYVNSVLLCIKKLIYLVATPMSIIFFMFIYEHFVDIGVFLLVVGTRHVKL